MRNSDKLLSRAKTLLRNRKYSAVIRLLESKVPSYLENVDFMLYLGAACFQIGDLGGAVSYLNRGDRIDSEHIPLQLYLAASHLKKNNTTEAVRIWLDILDKDQTNKHAKRGLAIIRDIKNPDEQRQFCQSKVLFRLVPGFGVPFSNLVFLFLIIVLAGIVLSFSTLFLSQKELFNNQKPDRAGNLGITRRIDFRQPVVEMTGSSVLILTEKEVADSFRKAVNYFNDGDDNAARLEINRLKMSNAAATIKGKVHLLEGHLIPPAFDTFRTNYTFEEIMKDPALHEGCFVLWKGRVSNLITDEKTITFDFLAGYDSNQVLEGIIPVHYDYYVPLNTDLPVEIIGQVYINQGKPELKGVAIHTIISE